MDALEYTHNYTCILELAGLSVWSLAGTIDMCITYVPCIGGAG